MLRSLSVTGFKSIGPTVRLDMAPLTLICGENSSGKSSLLQALLMLCQSANVGYSSESILVNGPLVSLGTVREIRHKSTAKSIRLALAFDAVSSGGASDEVEASPFERFAGLEGKIELEFSRGRSDTAARLDSLDVVTSSDGGPPSHLSAIRRRGGRPPTSVAPFPASGSRQYLTNHDYRLSVGPQEGLAEDSTTRSGVLSGLELRGFLPIAILVPYDPIARELTRRLQRALSLRPASSIRKLRGRSEVDVQDLVARFFRQPEIAQRFVSSEPWDSEDHRAALAQVTSRVRTELRNAAREYVARVAGGNALSVAYESEQLPWLLSQGVRLSARLLGEVRHVGPLRQEPRPLQAVPIAGDPKSVGRSGEFTAAVLSRYSDLEVAFDWDGSLRTEPLQQAVNTWLSRLGVHTGARSFDYGKVGHQLVVDDDSVPFYMDLTQVGVGVSQLLPIVVQCLVAPPDSTVLLEQPELHMHPRVQSRLGEFLLAVAKSGRQILCETHSEYLMNQLRIAVGSGKAAYGQDVRLVFTSRIQGSTRIEEVVINDKGRISNWPEGFLDQSVRDASDLVGLELGDVG